MSAAIAVKYGDSAFEGQLTLNNDVSNLNFRSGTLQPIA
jgi:hypothetical protein